MSPDSPSLVPRPPHPLALELIDCLRGRPAASILEIGRGSGRNTRALQAAGFRVETLGEPRASLCAAALSTHALLHGRTAALAGLLGEIAASLEPGAPLYATFGCVRDARFGAGTEIEPFVYAPDEGDERGVPHAFFDEGRLRAILSERFEVESLREQGVDEVAGSWAHPQAPLRGSVHWFAIAKRR